MKNNLHTPIFDRDAHFIRAFLPVTLALVLSLSGCASFRAGLSDLGSRESPKQYENVDIHSAYPTISRENIEQINLLELIDPLQQAKAEYPALWKEAEQRDGMRNNQKYGPRYDLTLSWFRQSRMPPEEKQLTRNGVQERMLSASMSRCNVFKTFLRRNQSDVNFYLGSATTVSGILGAVLPGVNASRNLAAAAGVFSGLEAEYNQSYFSNLTAEVLIKGIELRQATVQDQLRRVGQRLSISDYPMEAAIRDAIHFDGLCSTVVGLQQAAESISHEENPGLQQGLRTIARIKALNEIATAGNLSELQSSGKLDTLKNQIAQLQEQFGQSSLLAATSTSESAAPDISEQFFQIEPGLFSYLHAQANMLRDEYQKKYNQLLERKSLPEQEILAIAPPDEVRNLFEGEVKKYLVDKLNLNDCGNDIPELLSGLASARNALRKAGNESERIRQSEQVDLAVFRIRQKRYRLDQIIDAARQYISTAAQASRENDYLQKATRFNQLIPRNNKDWIKAIPETSPLPTCPAPTK